MNESYTRFLDELSVEVRVLLLSSRAEIPEEKKQYLRKIAASADWSLIHSLSLDHHLLPLVYRNLRLHLHGHVTPEEVKPFKESFNALCKRNILMSMAVEECIAALKESTIQAVPFKGPVLAALYGDISLRYFGDIDILVPEKAVHAAVQALEKIGYVPHFPLAQSQLQRLVRTDNEYPLQHHRTGLALDLQWELSGGYFKKPLRLADLQGQLQNVLLFRKEVQTFIGADLLLYLCIHGSQHVWQSLDHICAINEVIRGNPHLDWDKLFDQAERMGSYRMLCIGILLAKHILDCTIPGAVAERIGKNFRAMALAEQKCAAIIRSFMRDERGSLLSRRFYSFHLKSLDSRWAAGRYLFRLVFVPTRYDWQVCPLPVELYFLHYVLRPLRLLYQLVKGVWWR